MTVSSFTSRCRKWSLSRESQDLL